MPGGPGNLSWQMPPRPDDIGRRQQDLKRMQRESAAANILQAAQFGKGGILVTDNGAITFQGTGQLNTNGSLTTSGSFSANTSISAGTSITAGGDITSTGGNVSAAGTLSASGGITGASLNVGAGGVSGGAFSGSSLAASGSVSGSTGTFNGGLFSTAVYSTAISGTRTATWTQNDGTMGTAPSSIRFKTNVQPVGWDDARVEAILSAQAKYYQYKAELAKRDDPAVPGYVGDDYHVHTEVGYIAEELHAAGLWEVVIYERDEDGSPKLDEDGAVIPFGVHYELLGIYALEAASWLHGKLSELRADVDALKAHVGL